MWEVWAGVCGYLAQSVLGVAKGNLPRWRVRGKPGAYMSPWTTTASPLGSVGWMWPENSLRSSVPGGPAWDPPTQGSVPCWPPLRHGVEPAPHPRLCGVLSPLCQTHFREMWRVVRFHPVCASVPLSQPQSDTQRFRLALTLSANKTAATA